MPSNPGVGPSPRIKVSFLLLSTGTEQLISTPKIIQFLPNPLPTENVYQMQYHIQNICTDQYQHV